MVFFIPTFKIYCSKKFSSPKQIFPNFTYQKPIIESYLSQNSLLKPLFYYAKTINNNKTPTIPQTFSKKLDNISTFAA